MNTNELIPIYILVFALLFIILMIRLAVFRNSASASYLMRRKWHNINWKKAFKYWAIIQGFIILSKIDSLYDDLFFVVVTPIMLMSYLLIFLFSNSMEPNRENGEDLLLKQKEFEDYEKAFNRQKKIDKIIR
jgi:uncharacterized membrane protein YfcA